MNTTLSHVRGAPIPQHPGVARAERVAAYARDSYQRTGGVGVLRALLLAGVVAALVAAADVLVVDWAEGSNLLAWVMLWVVAFLAMALGAQATTGLAQRMARGWSGWRRHAALAREAAEIDAAAHQDLRVLHELQVARARGEWARY